MRIRWLGGYRLDIALVHLQSEKARVRTSPSLTTWPRRKWPLPRAVPRGYLDALEADGAAASLRVLPWSPLQGVARGHQPLTARR